LATSCKVLTRFSRMTGLSSTMNARKADMGGDGSERPVEDLIKPKWLIFSAMDPGVL